MRKRTKREYIVHNVEITFDILFFLAKNPKSSFEKIKDYIDISSYQLEKILNILINRGYIEFDKKRKIYSLGIKNFELGYSYLSHVEIRKQAKPYLQFLGEEIKENVYLAVRSGWEIVYIDSYEVDRPVMVKSRVGKLLPMYASASGKVHLAYMEKHELDEFFNNVELMPYTEKTITDKEKLIKHLKIVKEQGFAVDDEEWEKEVRCLSVPVFNYKKEVAAAITLSGPSFRVNYDTLMEIKEIFIEKSKELSERLGYSEEWEIAL
ncbi:MAG: IclR family transcriptional regulator [Aquificota bacterium]|nr:MAG: IclR family transcriptional regulator [Aquificota bacterium]